jgi:hypothetical protein
MSDKNEKSLCAYVEEVIQVKDPKAYLALISPANHYCKICGRSAVKAKNLCKPKLL